MDLKNIHFFGIYIGFSIALFQFVYYLNDYLKFDNLKKMEIGKSNFIQEFTVSNFVQ